jgi:hypothetical protein
MRRASEVPSQKPSRIESIMSRRDFDLVMAHLTWYFLAISSICCDV